MSTIAEAVVEPVLKKVRTEGPRKLIGTHNGHFHCDEALAVFLLKQTETYENADLIRTRDPAKLAQCDIIVDVGGVYDATIHRYDHHQRGFDTTFGEDKYTNIKLSSAGLVYKHFGKDIIARRLGLPISHPNIGILWLKMYGGFIEAIDAIDNGVSQFDTQVEQRYKIRTDLSSRVGWLNPDWQEKVDAKGVDERFLKASNMTGEEFLNRLDFYANSWLPARDIVVDALQGRKQVDGSGKIMVFESFAPWKEHLFNIEEELAIPADEKPLYVLYEDENKNWRIQAVPVNSESFESRKALPEAWRGIRDDALSELTGIPGCIFVHASGFIGGNKTKEGAFQLAKKSIDM
ncbi:hypothetical protein M422DRAFT_58209 [Sphaerobolus stellatus SS14]|nr:hypothetical protein M422DRAFT_58209 [Sphaerobolus stellatus SS14]